MKYIYFLVSIFISNIVLAQPDLDFQTTQGGWTTGTLSKSYTSVGTPATNVNVSLGGTTTGLQSNSPQAFSRGLQLAVNHTSNTACVTTTITFSPVVQGLTFRLLNVDRGAANSTNYDFIDQVTVSGMNGAASVTPTISASGTAGNYSSISGNTVTGTGDAPASASDPGNQVTFSGIVTEITITYCNNAAQTIANPGAQTITIEDLSWSAPLPVHVISFQGKVIGNQVALAWETAWEQNNDYFEVQRSNDAHEFVSVGRVAAVGQSDSRQVYSLLDQEPLTGTGYYRLKQVDRGIDQLVTYSKIIALILDDVIPTLAVIENPVEGEVIPIAFRNIEPHQLTLQTASGLVVPYRITNESATRAVLTPIQRLSPGLYLLSGQQGANRLTAKIVVL
ncbi:hypothetical protein [Spirosoma flavum]|uniref:T9SS type A sorting domain-containing protein n=1 Tax=Spirosoma flavum TaxID=2048557 RepID=A0ABW6ASZ2_9BACT